MGPREEDSNAVTMVMGKLADYNYYNDAQNLVRVQLGKGNDIKYLDLPLINNIEHPNPLNHYVIIYTLEKYLDSKVDTITPGDPRLDYKPGYVSPTTLANYFSYGFVWLVSNKIMNKTTNNNVSQMGNFNKDAKLMSDESNVRYSLSPALNKPYTTTINEHVGDINNSNIGIFMTDNSIHFKSEGGSIILGPDGISLLGERTETTSIPSKGIMKNSPIGAILPETLVSFPLTGPSKMFPDLEYVLAIGNTIRRTTKSVQALGKVTKIASDITKIG